MEQVQTHLKGMTMQLACTDVIPLAIAYEVKPRGLSGVRTVSGWGHSPGGSGSGTEGMASERNRSSKGFLAVSAVVMVKITML